MKILFLTHYFPPEVGAPQARIFEFARELAKRGHSVTILTPFPHYPTGRVPKAYEGKFIHREVMDGLKVVRTWVYATPNKGFLKRILNHLSFTCSAAILGPWLIERPDVMVIESPPLFTGLAGVWFKWLWRAGFVFNVADLWPESAVALGALTNKYAIRLAEWQEEFLYRQAARISVVTMGVKKRLLQRGQPSEKLVWIPNGVDVDFFDSVLDRQQARRQLGWPSDKIIALYGGTHGLAQGLDVILQAADMLRNRPEIEFIFVGDGADKAHLLQRKESLKLTNVQFLDSMPKTKMPTVLAASDVALIVLKDIPLFRDVIPSKIYETMAMERPIVLAVAGEAAELLEQASAGVCIKPEDATALAEAVTDLVDHPQKRVELGHNGRVFVTENFKRALLAGRLEAVLTQIKEGSSSK